MDLLILWQKQSSSHVAQPLSNQTLTDLSSKSDIEKNIEFGGPTARVPQPSEPTVAGQLFAWST